MTFGEFKKLVGDRPFISYDIVMYCIGNKLFVLDDNGNFLWSVGSEYMDDDCPLGETNSDEHFDYFEEEKSICDSVHKQYLSYAPLSSNAYQKPCSCDLYAQLLPYGCKCGDK